MKIRHIFAITAFILSACNSSTVTHELITFKDIPLGEPENKRLLTEICRQFTNNHNTHTKQDRCEFYEKLNFIWLSYGNLDHVFAKLEVSDKNSLDSVEIHENKGEILALVDVLQEKYGEPKKVIRPIENKLGTKFDKEIFIWVDAKGNQITVESIYNNINEGRVVIESAAKVSARTATENLLKEAVKSNL